MTAIARAEMAATPTATSATSNSANAARARILGFMLVFVSSVAFSTKAVLVKLAYRHGVEAVSLLALRFGFAAPLFALGAFATGGVRHKLTRRDAGIILLLGVLGYYAASLTDFIGLRYISAGLERLILFVYPTLVVFAEAVLFGVRIRRRQVLSLAITYCGIALAFSGELSNFGSDVPRGAAWVLVCAVTYGLYLLGAGRMVPRLGSQRFTSLALLAATAAVLIHAAVTGAQLLGLPPAVYGIGLTMALVATVAPAFLLARGIALIGSGPAAIVSTVGPVSTILLAYIFLGNPSRYSSSLGRLWSFSVRQWSPPARRARQRHESSGAAHLPTRLKEATNNAPLGG